MRLSPVRPVALLFVLALLALAADPVTAGGLPQATGDGTDDPDFDTTTFEIAVHENGSATWTFSYERILPNDTARSDFEGFAETYEGTDTPFYEQRVAQARALVRTADNETAREMDARSFSRSARVENRVAEFGVVELSFTWDGFAQVDGDRVVIDEVLSGLYLGENQRLVVTPGAGLALAEIQPDGVFQGESLEDAESVTWLGPRQFDPGEPYVALDRADGSSLSWPLLVGLLVGAVAVGTLAVLYRRRWSGPGETATAGGGSDAPEEHTPPELLSDEDRVVSLIRENGGRMKQVDIVEDTGWSKSKVSMLLSDMEEEGTISKLRVGRENIISLEGFEPEAAKSPHED